MVLCVTLTVGKGFIRDMKSEVEEPLATTNYFKRHCSAIGGLACGAVPLSERKAKEVRIRETDVHLMASGVVAKHK
jgi:hypothetical protein